MSDITSAERERQRFEHLVLERPRPAPVLPQRPKGMPKREWKVERQRLLAAGSQLAPGIEERVALRESWGGGKGTPETLEHAWQESRRPGSLTRLLASGAIDKDQYEAADQIREAYRSITAGLSIRTASLETRIDGGEHGRAEIERLGAIYADLTYDWWRGAVKGPVELLLAVIVHDIGLTIAARRHGMSMVRARRLLTDGLNLWWVGRGRTRGAALAMVSDG